MASTMNEQQKTAWQRVRMKRALRQAGHRIKDDIPTDVLEEMTILTFAPSVEQFSGLVNRAKEAIE